MNEFSYFIKLLLKFSMTSFSYTQSYMASEIVQNNSVKSF